MPNGRTSEGVDNLQTALQCSSTYPWNLFDGYLHDHTLKALQDQLDARAEQLFCVENDAAVHFFELARLDQGYRTASANSFDVFEDHLVSPMKQSKADPRQRFIFITAANSRSHLRITKRMLLHALTYHQVMPAFVTFLLPFGNQHYRRDFHSVGFRSATCMDVLQDHLRIPQLARSGEHIELCYSFKSVERSERGPQRWSIRQCSVYHKFDIKTEQMVWIVVKANALIQRGIRKHCKAKYQSQASPVQPMNLALAIHEILATWAGENWHVYINDLEAEVQDISRHTLVPLEDTVLGTKARSPTLESQSSVKTKHRRMPSFRSWISSSGLTASPETPSTGFVQSFPLNPLAETSQTSITVTADNFSFGDFQKVQEIEDKANQTLLILRANSRAIRELQHEYVNFTEGHANLEKLFKKGFADVHRFGQQLSNVIKDLGMEQDRVEVLIRMLGDRKALIQGILQYRNMEAAKLSASNMELMTENMHVIAKKTEVETISMRIITVVTLFFLPGTFISTLMSTPMVRFPSIEPGLSRQNIGVGALELYLILSVPLVCITFLAWFYLLWREKRRTRQPGRKDIES